MSKNYTTAAVIYIGSNAVTLKIGELSSKKIKYLEKCEYPLYLGKDTFSKEKIGFEKVDKLCEVLSSFKKIIEEYKVENVRVFATTAMREAKNKDPIADQINVRTGFKVNIIDDPEEKTYIYKEICRKLTKYTDFHKNEALITSIGTGSIGVAAYSYGNILFSQTLKVGAMKLSEIFEQVQEESGNFHVVLEEYLKGFTYVLKNMIPIKDIKYFIGAGQELHIIGELCAYKRDDNFVYIKRKDLYALYDNLKEKTIENIMREFGVNEEKAESILPSLVIYKTMLEFTEAEEILCPYAVLPDIVLRTMLYTEETREWNIVFDNNTIIAAKNLAKRYFYNKEHAEIVEKFALAIFDKLQKIHGMGERERLILQVGAILHDIGKYINVKNHYDHSYNIIKSSDVAGLGYQELEIAANIARYHSSQIPTIEHRGFKTLDSEKKLLVMKLSAILRLADSIDRSHVQKFEKFDIKYKNGILDIAVTTDANILLEEWTLNQKGEYFEDIFGIRPVLRRKRTI